MLTLDALRDFGADVDEGMSRCLNNEEFYIKLVKMAIDDTGFDKLKAAVESNDKTAAFEAAHALKGMLGNLALTPISEPAAEMTELLRQQSDADYAARLKTILEARDRLACLV